MLIKILEMYRLVLLCLVFIILRAEANVPGTENPEIRLSYTYNKEENYTVLEDKPLKIIIENGYARYVWCFDFSDNSRKFVPETEFSNDTINKLNITNVTAEMSTKWACMVLRKYNRPDKPFPYKNRNYSAKQLQFNLHVKGAGAVILIANNQSLTYITTNLSVNYDGEANYTYEDGEDFLMDFSCIKAKDNHEKDTLRLEYYNQEGILLFQTKPRVTPHMFRSVLKSNNDKYYLDCIRTAVNSDTEYRYRITFLKKKKLRAGAVIFSVNGQRLSTLINNDKLYDNYIFRYIDGEVLNVTCRKMDVNKRGTLTFYSNPDVNWLSQILKNPPGEVISLNISTSGIQNKSLTCNINNTDVEKPNAQLLFLSDVPNNDVRIRGLPRNNILYQYTNDKDQWTIEYQYSVNDTLDLTCVWNGGFHVSKPQRSNPYLNPFQWKSVDKSFDSAAIRTPSTQIKFSEIPFTQILNATHNGSKIKCIYFTNKKWFPALNKTVEIILRLKPESVLEADRDEGTSGAKDQSGAGGGSEPIIVPFAVGVGVAIFIITMVCLVLWRKRTKRVNLIENAYDNLSNQNDSPIPAFPSQWEANYDDPNYAKIDEGVMQENYNYSTDNDKFYSMPFKRQSNTSEHHYTEIDDYFKPKSDGLAANGNTAEPSNYNKQTDTLKVTPSHSSNNASYNNFGDSKKGTYDKSRHNNLPINNGYENYNKVQKPSKSVTFKQMSSDLRPGRNYSEGNSRQDGRNNDRKLKLNNEGYYANTGQNIYMQPEVIMHKKPKYENHLIKNEKTDNSLDSDYAEPYDEVGISCKNDFYG